MHDDLVYNTDHSPLYYIPINSIGAGSIQFSFSESIEWMRFENKNDYELYLNRLNSFDKQID
jgi:hypothetical protein